MGTKAVLYIVIPCYNEEKECVAECILESCHVLQVYVCILFLFKDSFL